MGEERRTVFGTSLAFLCASVSLWLKALQAALAIKAGWTGSAGARFLIRPCLRGEWLALTRSSRIHYYSARVVKPQQA
jgi:hypothetical protein